MNRRATALGYQIVAAALLGTGALLLVAVYLPLINPALFEFATDELGRMVRIAPSELGERAQPLSYYLIGTPLALLLLSAAWWFDIKGIRARGEI